MPTLTSAMTTQLALLRAGYERLRARLSVRDAGLLRRLVVRVRGELFREAGFSRLRLSAGAIIGRVVPNLDAVEAVALTDYVLAAIAAGEAGPPPGEPPDRQVNYNFQYAQLQPQMQHENRSYTAISNIMKTKYDTLKNSITNVR